MNELTPTSIFQFDAERRKREVRVIPISGANLSDIEDAEVQINNAFVDLTIALDAAFCDVGTRAIGVAENIRENVECGAMRTDDIQWRFAEAKNEAFALLADLRSDILGRLQKLEDVS